jgi:hypothetical protein
MCAIVGMGTRSVAADQGKTPMMAHVPTGRKLSDEPGLMAFLRMSPSE